MQNISVEHCEQEFLSIFQCSWMYKSYYRAVPTLGRKEEQASSTCMQGHHILILCHWGFKMPVYTFGTSGGENVVKYSVIAIINGGGRKFMCKWRVSSFTKKDWKDCILHKDAMELGYISVPHFPPGQLKKKRLPGICLTTCHHLSRPQCPQKSNDTHRNPITTYLMKIPLWCISWNISRL